jgi:hypothetical protein
MSYVEKIPPSIGIDLPDCGLNIPWQEVGSPRVQCHTEIYHGFHFFLDKAM